MLIGCQPLTVKAEGDGYTAVYTAWNTTRGWCFRQQDGTYLTPGIGFPMYYPTWLDLWAAVRGRPKLKLTARWFVA